MTNLSFFDKVYIIVQQIPRGKVTYYGRIAEMLDAHGAARTVGWALAALTPGQSEIVPWQRVINKAGRCSISSMEYSPSDQQALLEKEGVEFNENGYTDFDIFGWEGLNPDEVRELLTLFNHQ
jgi:methylated-DNA-protein-cysteine methyltransferase-like protein